MKSISQRISILEKRIGLNEDSDFEDDEQQFEDSVLMLYVPDEKTVSPESKMVSELISDIKEMYKRDDIWFKKISLNKWEIHYPSDHSKTLRDLVEGLEELFKRRGITSWEFD